MGRNRRVVVWTRTDGRLSPSRHHARRPCDAMSIFTDADSLAQQIGIAFVLVFLVLLIIRYILLLWLGYLHHLDDRRTSDPSVTVIVPIFNEEAVIVSALRSLLALRHASLEIIVVDDGSTDRTFERATSL